MIFETGYIVTNNFPTTIVFRKISDALQMFQYYFWKYNKISNAWEQILILMQAWGWPLSPI
jgi:hypothetical protein